MKSKLLTSIFILYFSCYSYSSESNFQNFPSEKIDKKINKYNEKLKILEGQWEIYDNLWETIDKLERNTEFVKFPNIEVWYKQHEKIMWEIIYLNDKIVELKNESSTLIN